MNRINDEQFSASEVVERYKSMLRSKKHIYFDVSEFEEIIDYYLESNKLEEAENAYQYAKSLHRYSNELKLKRAQILVDKQEHSEAETLLIEMASVMPSTPHLYFLFGYMYVDTGRMEEAAEAFSQFIYFTSESNKGDAYASVAFLYVQKNYYDEALSYLKKAEKFNQKSKYILYESAYCYEKIGEFEKSIFYYEKYLKLQPFSSNVWHNVGIVYDIIGNTDKAIEAYDYALALNPNFESALINKASVELNNGRYANALQSYETFLKKYPKSVDALSGIADSYRYMADYEQATEYYRKALKADKYHAHTLYGMALVYYEKNDNFEGLNYVLRALKNEKQNANYHLLAALFFDRLDYKDKAKESFIKSIENNPFSHIAWISLADLYVEHETEKAIELLEEAAGMLPNSAEIYYRLAAIYYQLQKFSEAEESLQQALNTDDSLLEQFLYEYPTMAKNEALKKLIDAYN